MKNIAKIISYLGLALTLLPAFFVFYGLLSFDMYKWIMALGTIMWFSGASFGIKK